MYRVHFLLVLSLSILNTHAQDEEPIPDFTTEIVDITMTEFIDPTAIDESDTTPGATTTSQQPYIPIPQVKIVGGEIVEHREEFAYQASLRYINQNYPFCGGTIISQTHILTASHCVVSDKGVVISRATIYVVVGDLKTDTPTINTLSRNVLEIMVHEHYSTATLENDIALLKITSLGTFNDFVDKVALSSGTPAEGTLCVVSGWGTTSAGGSASVVLRSVDVPIASLEHCTVKYSNQIYQGMLCAGYTTGQKDACQGDSGGPLVCNDTLAGVVSWGYSCAHPDFPGIYTDVSQYRDWIASHQGGEDDEAIDDSKSLPYHQRIVQNLEEFSYQASLRFSGPNYHFCGATIIDSKHVLTAAHCVSSRFNGTRPAASLSITVGNLNIREEGDNTLYRDVLDIYMHENFNPFSLQNDIAVVRVAEFEGWSSSINMVELSTVAPTDGSICTVSGWGAMSSIGNFSDVLRFDRIPILSNSICASYYQNSIRNGMICAGEPNGTRSSCEEDSGGPLICDGKLAGVVSWGFNCSQTGYPSVYTNVADYNSWISEQIKRSSSSRIISNFSMLIFILIYCFMS